MAAELKQGDRVQLADREATAEDVKSNLFFNHFRKLTGVIQKVYATQEASIEIELDALPETIRNRHIDMTEQKKKDWLGGLSEEARNRLTPKEREFNLRYTVLVALKDVTLAK